MIYRLLGQSSFLVLMVLAAVGRHGHGIDEVHGIPGGRVWLRAGKLCSALDRLRSDGLIRVEQEDTVLGRQRRYDQLTDKGGRRPSAEATRHGGDAAEARTGCRWWPRWRPRSPRAAFAVGR
jgi:Transcriptional regulator PadR-like family